MLSPECLGELRSAWLPNMTEAGLGRLIELLTSQRFTVEGVDVSAQMIAIAQQRHPNVVFHHADICQWVLPRRYDFITAWDSIWHVPLGHYVNQSVAEIRQLKTHGEKRVRVVLEVFYIVHELVSGCGDEQHFQFAG